MSRVRISSPALKPRVCFPALGSRWEQPFYEAVSCSGEGFRELRGHRGILKILDAQGLAVAHGLSWRSLALEIYKPRLWRLAVSSYCGCHRSTSIRAYDRYLRWLYRGGHPGRFARLQNRLSAVLFAVGVLPKRAACLDIRGRRSGRVISFPVAIADFEGGRYLVAMLGKNANWVLNLRAAGGRAVLRHGRRESVHLEEVDAALRAPILKRYLQVAPGARAHIPVDWTAPLADFERIAPDYPVFRIHSEAH